MTDQGHRQRLAGAIAPLNATHEVVGVAPMTAATTKSTRADLRIYLARAERDFTNEAKAHKATALALIQARNTLRNVMHERETTVGQLRSQNSLVHDYDTMKARVSDMEAEAGHLREQIDTWRHRTDDLEQQIITQRRQLDESGMQRERAKLAEQALFDAKRKQQVELRDARAQGWRDYEWMARQSWVFRAFEWLIRW